MKQSISPCSILAAAGTEELMRSILLILRDVGQMSRASGPELRIRQAHTVTEIAQSVYASGSLPPPELILYGMSRRDVASFEEILLIAGRNPRMQIILLVSKEVQDQIGYRCRNYPVYVLTLPLKRQILTEMIRMFLNLRARTEEQETDLQRMRKKLNEISIVTRAKCLLIQMRQMTEEEAHYYLEKRAMDSGLSKKDAATEIIRMYT